MYYVYHLVDPRDGKPFYVGKGKGSRIREHEVEARRGVTSAKCIRIREIWSADLPVGRVVVKTFDAEADALAFETEQIAAFPNLTNVASVIDPDALGYVREEAVCVVALVIVASGELRSEVTFRVEGGGELPRMIWAAFNDLGPVTYIRDFLRRWIKQDGEAAVLKRLSKHGISALPREA